MELTQAIKEMKKRLLAQIGSQLNFRKSSPEILTPRLLNTFNETKNEQTLPSTPSETLISVIPKPRKDLGLCGNDVSISLINCDIKILAKALDMLLDKIVSHTNQVGFLHNRRGSDNFHQLTNVTAT